MSTQALLRQEDLQFPLKDKTYTLYAKIAAPSCKPWAGFPTIKAKDATQVFCPGGRYTLAKIADWYRLTLVDRNNPEEKSLDIRFLNRSSYFHGFEAKIQATPEAAIFYYGLTNFHERSDVKGAYIVSVFVAKCNSHPIAQEYAPRDKNGYGCVVPSRDALTKALDEIEDDVHSKHIEADYLILG